MGDFADFDSFDEFQDDIQEETFSQSESQKNVIPESETFSDETNLDTNLWLIFALISLTLIHSFSDKWIDLIVRLTASVTQESSHLIEEIKSLKQEQNSISQADEFAKHSKLERKILKLRQELESQNHDSPLSRVQAKAAFVTLWRVVGGLSSMFLMWNYYHTPIHTFSQPTWWQPMVWIISFPTGIPGAVGLPFFGLTLRTVISNCRAGISMPQMPK